MVKLIDIINKLKLDYQLRQQKIEDILDNTNKMMIAHAEAMGAMKKLMVTIQLDVIDLTNDYRGIKEKLDNLKKNRWLRLFGVK